MKNVLLIEDNRDHIFFMEEDLRAAGFDVRVVDTLPRDPQDATFQKLLGLAGEFDIIVWDADIFVGHEPLLTFNGHIQEFAKVFKGPMIANSSVSTMRQKQIQAGCTHEVSSKDSKILAALLKSF